MLRARERGLFFCCISFLLAAAVFYYFDVTALPLYACDAIGTPADTVHIDPE